VSSKVEVILILASETESVLKVK